MRSGQTHPFSFKEQTAPLSLQRLKRPEKRSPTAKNHEKSDSSVVFLRRKKGDFEMEATPPATPRHTMFPLWLLPSGSDQVHG